VDWLQLIPAGSSGHGNEPSGSTKGGEFIYVYRLFNKDCTPSSWLVGWLVG